MTIAPVPLNDVAPATVILANGEIPTGAARAFLDAAATLVACDGARRTALLCGREPDWTVGDGDSLSASDKAALGDRFVRVPDENTNDLDKAFRFVRSRLPDAPVVIVGAGGGREDHLLGNVFRLFAFAREMPGVALVTNAGRFDLVADERVFASVPDGGVSVFASRPGAHAVSEGLRWPLEGALLDDPWSGTLNRAEGESFTVRTDVPLLVYRAFERTML